ncbi:MAG: S8 family serine peptidase, partial [Flavobacteriales bacterium]
MTNTLKASLSRIQQLPKKTIAKMISAIFFERRTFSSFLTLILLTASIGLSAQNVHKDYIDGRIFVKIERGVALNGESASGHGPAHVDPSALGFLKGVQDEFQIDRVTRPFHALKGEAPELKRTYRVRFDAIQKVDRLIKKLEEHPSVDYAEKEPLMQTVYSPNDPYYTNNNQWFLPQINAAGAWDISFGTSSVTVAITDNAIDTAHEDLNGILWENPGEIPNNGSDDDGNGYADDYRGYDVGENDGDPTYGGAAQKHGTHVAGLSGGHTDNGTGIASIGFGVSIMAVKIADGSGSL